MWSIYNYYAQNGGAINACIFISAVIIVYIAAGKLLQFRRWRKHINMPSAPGRHIAGIPMSELHPVVDAAARRRMYTNLFREKLLELIPRIERGLDTMAALIQAAPLLGLLGTVVGMIKTFSLITTYGTANPVILTEGITVSLLTTQAGLLVAFPGMLLHNYVKTRKEIVLHELITRVERDIQWLCGKEGGRDV